MSESNLPEEGIPDNQLVYDGYSLGTTIEEANQKFEARHGRKPDKIFRYKKVVFVGPISEVEIRDRFSKISHDEISEADYESLRLEDENNVNTN